MIKFFRLSELNFAKQNQRFGRPLVEIPAQEASKGYMYRLNF
jgi:hypothetical protein